MNLVAAGSLTIGPETGVWYRAIDAGYWPTALHTAHSIDRPSRFSAGPLATPTYEILYLAEDPQVALFETGALFGSPTRAGGVLPHPRLASTILNVRVSLQQVADLTDEHAQQLLATTAQELTGDWEGYQGRGIHTSVRGPVGLAPTQELGSALFGVAGLEAFRAVSARVPHSRTLVVFPQKLLPGSSVSFVHATLGIHVIPRPTGTP